MKKLLLFALCALMFAACEPTEGPATNSGKLTLTSKSVMNFETLGGTGEITFDFVADETRQGAPVTVTCAEDWITNIKVGERKVTFIVELNESSERTAKIKLTSGQETINVMVIQAGGTAADTNFKATHLGGSYFGKSIGERGQVEGYNYFVILSDQQPDGINTIPDYATQYRFDLYAAVCSEFNHKEIRIPVGTYTIDHQGTGRAGTIDGKQSIMYDSNLNSRIFGSATLVVTETGIIADIVFMNGETHRITYSGEPLLEKYSEPTYADVFPVSNYTDTISFDVTGGYMYAYFRGDWFATGHDVWFMHMIEKKDTFSGIYLIFNFIVPKSVGGYDNPEGFLGEYTLSDPSKSLDYTFPAGRIRDEGTPLNAVFIKSVGGQLDPTSYAPIVDGTIKVEKIDGDIVITVDGKDDAGNDIKGTFSGNVREMDNQSIMA